MTMPKPLPSTPVQIVAGGVPLAGDLIAPDDARGFVLFAHGSGSSRHSRRNRQVADYMNRHGLATLLMDLLSTQEEAVDMTSGHYRFDVDLLGARVVDVLDWAEREPSIAKLPKGLFGASTGAAAALVAAAKRPESARAVVSRGGRPDLAGAALQEVQAPTLLIVGGADEQVLALNRQAADALQGEVELEVVPSATHLFEEPGALEEVSRVAADWFLDKLPQA